MTRWPWRESAIAAVRPAIPTPMIVISRVRDMLMIDRDLEGAGEAWIE